MYKIFVGSTNKAQSYVDLEEVAQELISAGVNCDDVQPAVAVYESYVKENGGLGEVEIEDGYVLAFENYEIALRAAYWMKPRLRLGTFGIKLNECVPENKTFYTHFDYDQDVCAKLKDGVNNWIDLVIEARRKTGFFVTAVLYDSPKGVKVMGNANAEMVDSMEKWQSTIIEIVKNAESLYYPKFN